MDDRGSPGPEDPKTISRTADAWKNLLPALPKDSSDSGSDARQAEKKNAMNCVVVKKN